MEPANIEQAQVTSSSDLLCDTQGWGPIQVQRLQNPPGEGPYHCKDRHTLFMSLSPRPIHYLQAQDGKTYTGLYRQGDLLITPANTPLFVQWEGDENCLQVQLSDQFLRKVASETLRPDCDRLELLPTFQVRDAQISAIGTMLLTELQQEVASGRLYWDSLANILAVNLLRQHATTRPQLPIYEGGLPHHQLQRVLDYIDAHLDQDIKLADLAELLDMSSFHFSRLFKQSVGRSPHQFLMQKRVERAKQLLKRTDHLIVDIALACGFNSHSHLSRQFRQVTGITPKAYREA